MPKFVLRERGRMEELPLDALSAGKNQPRQHFESAALEDLAASIRLHGLLQPILVRRLGGGHYEIVAGERRVRAAKMAGIAKLPALVIAADEEGAAVAALVENLQRADLDPFEEAEGLERLIRRYGLTQEEAARQIGKSQPTVANKLRLLRLDARVKDVARAGQLSERHLRALLKLTSGDRQLELAKECVERQLTAQEAEARATVISREITAAAKPTPGRRVGVIRDLRIFLNAFRHATQELHRIGVAAQMEEREEGEFLVVTVRIPKGRT